MLVTGGAGFIGVNAVRHFVAQGWDVTIFDNFSRKGTEYNIEKLTNDCHGRFAVVRGDTRRDVHALRKLAEHTDVILHLAAQVAVTTSVVDPQTDFDCNALGTFNVLEAARLSTARPILLYASTNKVYGALEDVPVQELAQRYAFTGGRTGVSEAQPLDFHSPYGCSKGAADQYVRDYARIYGLKTVVFRQSCIYGPHQMGIEDQGWVAWFLIAGLFGRPVQIYGDGKQVRDLLYVDDLVACYERAIERIDHVAGKVFNLGGGAENTLSLLEFFSLLAREHSLTLTSTFAPVRPGDQPIFVSDNSAALRDLSWKPTVGVHEGIARLLEWLRAHQRDLAAFYDGRKESMVTRALRRVLRSSRTTPQSA
ncbi:MAG: GDP-mannose 4,6-dehydratase [Candidatus Peribacteraceae bacterium]|nr:GDP-mannose 4,6-dehydratase [Candidatus Peribacteraceae bacterium]